MVINTHLRNLATALILYEKVDTTESRAKQLQPFLDRLLTLASRNNLSARRQLHRYLFNHRAIQKTFDILVPNILQHQRRSGYTNLYRLGARPGDRAEKVRLVINASLTEPTQLAKTLSTKK